MNAEIYKNIRVKTETWRKLKKVAFEMEIPLTKLIDMMLEAFQSGKK